MSDAALKQVIPAAQRPTPLDRTPLTKAELAYHHLRREIIAGILPPGFVLDQEVLAERLGLSTTPIREALRLLETESLVLSRRHRNTVVAPIDLNLLDQTYAVRLNLDTLAVSLAAENATQAQREAIRHFNDHPHEHYADATSDPLNVNRNLHRLIYSASGNEILTGVLDQLWDRSDRYRAVFLEEEVEVRLAHAEHVDIVAAVLSGDGGLAASLMRKHVFDAWTRIRQVFIRRTQADS